MLLVQLGKPDLSLLRRKIHHIHDKPLVFSDYGIAEHLDFS